MTSKGGIAKMRGVRILVISDYKFKKTYKYKLTTHKYKLDVSSTYICTYTYIY